jgi:hypothetical protein
LTAIVETHLARRSLSSGSGSTLNLPVHGCPGNAQQLSDLAAGVFAGIDEAEEVLPLVVGQLGLLPAEPALDLASVE